MCLCGTALRVSTFNRRLAPESVSNITTLLLDVNLIKVVVEKVVVECTRVTNNINDASVLFRCATKP